jgi:hypothetical protein
MHPIHISSIPKDFIVRFSGERFVLPQEWQEKVDTYWESLLQEGRSYTRGDVFTVSENEEKDGVRELVVKQTDYAHYLYWQNVDLNMDGCGVRIICTSCLVETSDGKTIFGKMGSQTARAGVYQLSGGGIDRSDIRDDGTFDFRKNITKELSEELGINVSDTSRVKSIDFAYLKQGGETGKIHVVFYLKLTQTAQEFLQSYGIFVKSLREIDELPEFGEIVALENAKDEIVSFFDAHRENCDEYMEPLLLRAFKENEKIRN